MVDGDITAFEHHNGWLPWVEKAGPVCRSGYRMNNGVLRCA